MINTAPWIHLPTSDRLLYAAMQMISETGLKGLSASKLASLADVSKSTVFHHFKKMEDIPVLVLEKLYEEIIYPIQEEAYASVSEYLKALGRTSFSDNEQHIVIYKAFASLFHASMHDANLKQIVNSCSHKFGSMLYTKLRSLSPISISDDTLMHLSHLIFMSLDGISLHYLIHGNYIQAQESWELLVNTIVSHYHLDKEKMK